MHIKHLKGVVTKPYLQLLSQIMGDKGRTSENPDSRTLKDSLDDGMVEDALS